MISGMALMEGRGINGMTDDMENEYTKALIKNCKIHRVAVAPYVLRDMVVAHMLLLSVLILSF